MQQPGRRRLSTLTSAAAISSPRTPATPIWPYSPQVYWSVAPESERVGEIVAVALASWSRSRPICSTRIPRIDVRSSLPADEVLLVSVVGDELLVDSHADGVQCKSIRGQAPAASSGVCQGGELSYAEIMPTSDFRQLAVERASTGEVCNRAGNSSPSSWKRASFAVRGCSRSFVPRENDVQLVAECCQAIESRPLPLTT